MFRDAERIAQYNLLRRVPTLVLPSGEVLVESSAILDSLDDQIPDEQRLLPRSGPVRRAGLRVTALACSLADKGVALVHENVAREAGSQSTRWAERCTRQVEDTLALLERERAQRTTRWWFGETLSHADIALGVVVRFLAQGVPKLLTNLPLPSPQSSRGGVPRAKALSRHRRTAQLSRMSWTRISKVRVGANECDAHGSGRSVSQAVRAVRADLSRGGGHASTRALSLPMRPRTFS